MKNKKCTVCGEIKPLSAFCKDKSQKDGLHYRCRVCVAACSKEHYEKNREKRKQQMKEHYEKNREKRKQQMKERYRKNREKIKEYSKEYHKKNREKIKEYKKEHNKKKFGRPCTSKTKFKQLPITDQPRWNKKGQITVVCKNCGKRFTPIHRQVHARVSALNGWSPGENNFYCSDKCKQECPLFNFTTGIQTDPRSKLAPPQDDKDKGDSCRTSSTRHIKQSQRDEYGYNFCERCGSTEHIELHHTLPVAKHGTNSISAAGHILLCRDCHQELHSQCAA